MIVELVLALSGADGLAVRQQAPQSPVASFLKAADENDQSGITMLLGKNAKSFLKKIDSCYLRRVYGNSTTGEILAAWMCAEGDTRSRVLMANVAAKGDGVVVQVVSEQTNARPAPPRTGSALAEEQK